MATNSQAGEAVGKKIDYKQILNKYGIYLILIALIILMGILTKGDFIKVRSLVNILRQASFVSLIAVGVTIIIITTGIDLSSGSVLAMAAVVGASMAHPGQYPVFVPILAALAVATLAGVVNGVIIAFFQLPPFIVTLGMMTAARGVALLYTNGKPIGDFSDAYNYIGQGEVLKVFKFANETAPPFGIPFPVIILAIVTIFTYIVLNKTRFGRHIYALGGNEQAAIISGVNVKKIKIIVYAYASFLAGLAGIALSSRLESANPGAGVSYELDAIAGAVIGGTSQSTGGIGTVQGTIVGALIIFIINAGMNMLNINSYWQQIVKAIIIIGAVLLDKRRTKV